MKLLKIAFLAAAVLGTANAATVSVFNLTGSGTDLALVDPSGAPLENGFLGMYVFGPGNGTPPTTVTDLQANGDTGLLATMEYSDTSGVKPAGGAFFAGFGFANPGPTNGAGQYDGQNLYLVIGNGANAAASSALALVNLNVSPSGSDAPPPGWNGGNVPLSSTLAVGVGEVGTITVDWSSVGLPASYDTASLKLAAVPEASALLLGLVGFVGLLRRRR